jgi:hypothetical protein
VLAAHRAGVFEFAHERQNIPYSRATGNELFQRVFVIESDGRFKKSVCIRAHLWF